MVDFDIRQIEARGAMAYTASVLEAELSDGFWTTRLPQQLETSSLNSPYFRLFQAAQVKLNDLGFLSRDITVRDLILNHCDVHHISPRDFLKKQGLGRSRYNQIANYALAQSEINIAISNKPPAVYFRELLAQCDGGAKKYGGITERDELDRNLRMHCIPERTFDELAEDYGGFLEARRRLMAARLREYFAVL